MIHDLGINNIGLFCGAVFLLNITPGPDTAYIVGRSIAQGKWAGTLSALGTCAGCCVHVLAMAFGLTTLIATTPEAFAVIKWLGAAYLVYLGIKTWRDASTSGAAPAPHPLQPLPQTASSRSTARLFVQGFLTNVLNPKVFLFFLSFFPQFVSATSSSKVMAFLGLGAVFVGLTAVNNIALAWLAGRLTQRFRRMPSARMILQRALGVAFIALGLRLAAVRLNR